MMDSFCFKRRRLARPSSNAAQETNMQVLWLTRKSQIRSLFSNVRNGRSYFHLLMDVSLLFQPSFQVKGLQYLIVTDNADLYCIPHEIHKTHRPFLLLKGCLFFFFTSVFIYQLQTIWYKYEAEAENSVTPKTANCLPPKKQTILKLG